MLAGTLYMIGGAYTQYLRGHISVDTLFNYLSPRWQTHHTGVFAFSGVLPLRGCAAVGRDRSSHGTP